MRFICPEAKNCNATDCIHKIPHEQQGGCHIDISGDCPQCVPYEEKLEDVEIYYSGQPDYLQEE